MTQDQRLHENLAVRNLRSIDRGEGELLFDSVIIFLNGGCNFSCKGCYTAAPEGETAKLDIAKIKNALDFARKRGAESLLIPGYGEPLLDEDFFPIIRMARRFGMQPVIYSNGSLIDRAAALELKELNVKLILKRNSLNKARQDALVSLKGASDLMDCGMTNILDAGFSAAELAVDSYIIKPILEDLKDVLRNCRKLGVSPHFEAFENAQGKVPEDLQSDLLSDAELTDFFNELAEIDRSEFGLDVDIPDGVRVYSPGFGWTCGTGFESMPSCCSRVFTTFCVAHDGGVRLCVDHLKTVGNISQKSLDEIFDVHNPLLIQHFAKSCSYQSARYRRHMTHRVDESL